MCGIAGIVEFGHDARASVSALREMCRVMTHRGPDDEGFYSDGCLGTGMRRLSIVDLATGHQPISNEDGSLWIVFNGEIYNHLALREQLITRGHRYSTHSDTETIVHAFEEYGADCVQHLRGMFAFAIWNRNTKTLFIARDRLGIKPLYYQAHAGAVTVRVGGKSRARAWRHPSRSSTGPRCPNIWLSATSLAKTRFIRASAN